MKLKGKKIAILSDEGFEEVELTSPKHALEKEGAEVHIVSPKSGSIKSWKNGNWNLEVGVDDTIDKANPNDYAGLVLPGGVINPDKLRINEKVVKFVSDFFEQGKPIAAICHGPQTLIETGKLNGRIMTSFPSIKTDLQNAGVNWEDKEVVVDHGLVTSRSPEDLEAFNAKMVEEFTEGVHEEQMS